MAEVRNSKEKTLTLQWEGRRELFALHEGFKMLKMLKL